MTWLIFVATWLVGTTLTLRVSTLMMMSRYQQRHTSDRYYPHPDRVNYLIGIVMMTIFWPGTALVFAIWKLAFPRGITTSYDRERKLQAALREAEQETKDRDRRIKELEKQVLAWAPSRRLWPESGEDGRS